MAAAPKANRAGSADAQSPMPLAYVIRGCGGKRTFVSAVSTRRMVFGNEGWLRHARAAHALLSANAQR
jgi:hypothetical protein